MVMSSWERVVLVAMRREMVEGVPTWLELMATDLMKWPDARRRREGHRKAMIIWYNNKMGVNRFIDWLRYQNCSSRRT